MSVWKLRDKLQEGLHQDNLWKLGSLARELAMDDPHPLPFFVLSEVFLEIAQQWDEVPVVAEVASQVRSSVQAPLAEVLDGLENGIPQDDLFDCLERLVSALLSVLRVSNT